AYYSPEGLPLRSNTANFVIGDRIFYTGGGVTTDLFYLELGQGPFKLTDPPFYLIRTDMPNLYAEFYGNAVVIDQTAFIFMTNDKVVSYALIKRNETQNSNLSPGRGRPRTVVDKNGLIYMWFTPDKYSSIDNADENLYIFDSVKY
ncbi:18394_t:CDS:2, partial [Racocetra fulgida]